MPVRIKESKNIPVSISLLHEQEYNIYLMFKSVKNNQRRRAFSENSADKNNNFVNYRRKTLKN
jgi:hypothetical protein